MTDYLAVIMMNAGGGSWYRDPDKAKAIASVAHICKQDWKTLYKFQKGSTITVNVIDVEGFDCVHWDERGFFHEQDGRRIAIDRKIEQVIHTY